MGSPYRNHPRHKSKKAKPKMQFLWLLARQKRKI